MDSGARAPHKSLYISVITLRDGWTVAWLLYVAFRVLVGGCRITRKEIKKEDEEENQEDDKRLSGWVNKE